MSSSGGSAGGSGGSGGDPWAWLGVLKWSLSYSDGTKDSSETMSPMSTEDKEFLEKVMKEGIIDENERMKYILQQLTSVIDYYKDAPADKIEPPITQDNLQDLLLELQDIVEQIDYARAFCSLKGLPFLLGCISSSSSYSNDASSVIPEYIRLSCLGIIATLCQNNPPVQKELLKLGSLKILSEVYFAYSENDDPDGNGKQKYKYLAKIMQAISANVRNHAIAETVFTHLQQSSTLIESGLTIGIGERQQLQSRTLFFLRAFLTSDTSNDQRINKFENSIIYVIDNYLATVSTSTMVSPDLFESALGMIEQLLQPPLPTATKVGGESKDDEVQLQPRSIPKCVIERKDTLDKVGRQRVKELQSLTGDDREYAQIELDLWLSVMKLL